MVARSKKQANKQHCTKSQRKHNKMAPVAWLCIPRVSSLPVAGSEARLSQLGSSRGGGLFRGVGGLDVGGPMTRREPWAGEMRGELFLASELSNEKEILRCDQEARGGNGERTGCRNSILPPCGGRLVLVSSDQIFEGKPSDYHTDTTHKHSCLTRKYPCGIIGIVVRKLPVRIASRLIEFR